MRLAVLVAALVASLWPVAAIAYAVDRVFGGDDGAPAPAAVATATTTAPAAPPPAATPAVAAAGAPAAAPSPAPDSDGSLEELNRLRGETADLVAALEVSPAASGQPDAVLAAQALDVEAALVDWQEANAGGNADAAYFADLFAAIAAAAADFATAPDDASRQRLRDAIARHRGETLQEGG